MEGNSLPAVPADDFSPRWSPDGSRLAFVSDRDGNEEIYVMNSDGSGQTRLTDSPASDAGPSWSSDGKRITFVSERDGEARQYSMNADGTNQAHTGTAR
jgi:Tol biopolymer transport system component